MTPTNTETNPWSIDDAANADVPEPPKLTTSFGDLPNNAYVLVRNATSEQKEGSQPRIDPAGGKDGRPVFYKFKTAFIVEGGDDKIKPEHVGRYIFFETSVHRHPEKDNQAMPVAGVLYNLLLDVLSPEPGPAKDRFAKALAILAAKAQEMNFTLESMGGDKQMLYAVCLKEVMKERAYNIIGQIYVPKARNGFQPKQTLGSIEAATTENMAARKVRRLEKQEDSGF